MDNSNVDLRSAAATRLEVLGLALVALTLLLPWLDKGFDIDDPLFLWSAQGIVQDPLDFYGGEVNWYGSAMPLAEVTKNPPLHAYYLALAGRWTAFREAPLHAAMLLPAVAAIIGAYLLAGRFCNRPALAAALTLATPAFLVSATSVMCDVPMTALWVWAFWFWIRGIDERRPGSLWCAALLIAACSLTKYFGIALVPLAAVYGGLQRRRLGAWLAPLSIPLLTAAAFEWWMRWQYQTGAFLGAATYAVEAVSTNSLSPLGRGLIALFFAGGSLLPVVFFTPWLWSRRGWLGWIALAAAAAAGLAWWGTIPTGGPRNFAIRTAEDIQWNLLWQATLFAVAGVQVLSLAGCDVASRRDVASVILALWLLGALVFTAWINWSINARSILPAAPAVAILLARRWELRAAQVESCTAWRLWAAAVPLSAAALVTLALVWADYRSANANRAAALELPTRYGPKSGGPELWFVGHWGFQYYLLKSGGVPLDITGSDLSYPAVIAMPDDNPSGIETPDDWGLRETIDQSSMLAPGVTLLSIELQASFYSSVIGPLPYLFGPAPSRAVRVYDPYAGLLGLPTP